MVATMQPGMDSLALADLTLLAARLFVSPARQAALEPGFDEALRTHLESASLPTRDLASILAGACRAPADERRAEWNRLFEGSVICPINETAYVRRDKGMIIGDICGFYQAFGFEPDATSGEKADHLITELEYIVLLLIMLANAERDGSTGESAITTDALRAFLADHVGEWIRLFAARLAASSPSELYGGAAAVLELWWDALARRFGLPAFDRLDDTPGDVEFHPEDTPYECDLDQRDSTPFVPLTGPHTMNR